MAKKLTSEKAKEILRDKSVHGKPLTEKQRKFFGAIAGGAEPYKAQIGTMLTALPSNMMDRLSDALAFPQRAITKLFTGEYQTPSEAMKIQNPMGAAATDILLDPLNLVGAGLAGKAAKASTKTGILSKTYKINPWAFKPNESNWYRQVGKSAIDDAVETGLVREAGEEVSPRMWGEFQDQIKRLEGIDELPYFEKYKQKILASRRPTSPFFAKGELFYPMGRKPTITKTGKVSKNPAGKGDADYLIETNLPNESFQPAYAKGMYSGVPTEVGSTAILKPDPNLRTLDNFRIYEKNWLKGYKEIKPKKKQDGGWLDKYEQGGLVLKQKKQDNYGTKPNVNDDKATYPDGFVGWEYDITGRNYSPAWGGQFAMGGSLPGATGMMYARTINPAPSNGPYAKKTKASAQDGDSVTKGKEFLTKMAKSPLFGERYATMTNRPLEQIDPKEIEDYRGRVLKNLETVKIAAPGEEPEPDFWESHMLLGGMYLPSQHKLYVNKIYNTPGTVTHELSHSITKGREDLPFSARPFNYVPPTGPGGYYEQDREYLTTPTEIKARRDAVAQMAMEKGIWNPTTEKFTEKHYDQLKAIEKELSEKIDKNIPVDNKSLDVFGQFRDITIPYSKEEAIRIFNSFVKGKDKKGNAPIAQNGQEMKYYQEGLDFKPKTISQDGTVIDPMGYWNPENVGEPVIIPSNVITMEGVDQPLLGISDTGDVQYMEPGEDYEFDGEYVTEYPVAQKGKTIPAPTTADSARLYNAQMALNKFYENEVKAGRLKKENQSDPYTFSSSISEVHPQGLRQANLDFYRGEINQRNKLKGRERYSDESYKQYFNLSPEQVKQLEYEGLGQTKRGSEYQDYYRDIITPMQNLAAPFALVDYRIRPQREILYSPINKDGVTYPGGDVMVYDYDPLGIKPYHMRTPKEKIEWEKKYGKKETTKAKPTPSPVKKKVVTPAPEPVKETKAPEPVRQTAPLVIPSFTPPIVPSGSVGVFGPGKARIGEYDEKTNTFYPDYGNLAARSKVNQSDTDLLTDQEKLASYIASKTGKKPKIDVTFAKQRNGGVNNADAQPEKKLDQLLNFTNYNKPTKGGWLDKYQ